eukprot:6491572-Amphidinium_carterae.1
MFAHLLAAARVASAIFHDIATLRYWDAAIESINVQDCTRLVEIVASQIGKGGHEQCVQRAVGNEYCFCFWRLLAILAIRLLVPSFLAGFLAGKRKQVRAFEGVDGSTAPSSPDEEIAAAGVVAPRAGEWHERLLLERVVADNWIVLSRDFDYFSEDFALSERVYRRGARGGLPPEIRGVDRRRVFEIDINEFIARRGEVLAEGHRLAIAERGPVAVAPRMPDRATEWISMESRAELSLGASLSLQTGVLLHVEEDRCLYRSAAGTLVSGAVVGSWTVPRQEDDLRTLPVRYRAGNERFRDFADASEKLTVTTLTDWRIQGPRTCRWLMQQMAGLGQTPSTRHYWWRGLLHLSAADPGIDEMECLSEVFELALCHDQLNIAEISAFEVLARRWQLWEEIYGAELAETDAGQGADGWTSEREMFLGRARGRSSALVMPELEMKGGKLGRRRHFSGARLPLRQEVIQHPEVARALESRGERSNENSRVATESSPDSVALSLGRPCALEEAAAPGFGTPSHSARDLLPLPAGYDLATVLRREGLATDPWLADGIHHLNLLGGGGRPSPRADQVSTVQRKALSHLAALYADADLKDCVWTPSEACTSLLGMNSGYTDDMVLASGGTATYKRGAKLALPSMPAGRVALMPSLKGCALLQQDSAVVESSLAPFGRVALDSKLSLRGYDYSYVLEQLFVSEIIELGGDLSLRIIFDTRRSNCHFSSPPKTLLPSSECIGELETNSAFPLSLASGDVE